MNNLSDLSRFLVIKNFHNYQELKAESGVYIFISNNSIQRLVGESNILKIGQTSNLKRRMSAYFREENPDKLKNKKKRQTAYRLSRYLRLINNCTLLFMPAPLGELKSIEKSFLKQYYENHYESPPLNMGLS
jgi:hypothetical protein